MFQINTDVKEAGKMNVEELKKLKEVFDCFEELENDLETVKGDIDEQMQEASNAEDVFGEIARNLDYQKDNIDTLTNKINEMRSIVYKILTANLMTCSKCGHDNCFD